jgi:CRAL/TRIO domain
MSSCVCDTLLSSYLSGATCHGAVAVAKSTTWVCITLLQVIRDNYPEVCHRAYIAPSNFIFMLIWSIARLMLDAKQGARVVVSTKLLIVCALLIHS